MAATMQSRRTSRQIDQETLARSRLAVDDDEAVRVVRVRVEAIELEARRARRGARIDRRRSSIGAAAGSRIRLDVLQR